MVQAGSGSVEDDSSAVAVSRGASYLTMQFAITTLAQVVSFAVLARIVTPSEIGILAILSLTTSLCQSINGSAFQQASIKYIGEFAGTRDELARGVFYQTLRLSFIIAIPLAAIIFVGSGQIAQRLIGSATEAGLFKVVAVDVLAYSGLLPVTVGAVLGMKRFKAAATIGAAGAILRQCLIILLILFLKDFIGLVYAWVFSDFAMLAGYTFYVARVLGAPKNTFPLKELVNFSWPLTIGNIVSFIYSWFDRAILIIFVPLAALGVYTAALTAFSALVSITGAFNNALLPAYANIRSRNGLAGCRNATRLSSRYASLLVVPLSFGLLAIAKPALTLFVGRAYIGGAEPLMILCLVYALTAFGLGLSPMLVALAETRASMWITLLSILLAVGSAYFLLPLLGIIGASIARGIAMVAGMVVTVIFLKRKQALGVDVEMTWKSLVAGGVMAAVLVVVEMVRSSVVLFPVYLVVAVFVYLIVLRLLKAVKGHDMELIERYLGPRLNFLGKLLGAILVAKGSVTD